MTPELETYLTERFQREREATLDLVVGVVERLLNEQIRRDGEVCKRAFEHDFTRLQELTDQLRSLIERLAHLDRAARNEPVVDNSVKIN